MAGHEGDPYGGDPGPDDELEHQLAGLLAGFAHMHDPAGRQAVVRTLARRSIDILASAPRSNRTAEDLRGLVQTAADHPGGPRQLLDAVGDGYEGTHAWAAADAFVQRYYPVPLLSPGERAALLALLRTLRRSTVEELRGFAAEWYEDFAERLLSRRARLRRKDNDLSELVAVLEDAPVVPDQVHPLTAFVESAAAPEDRALRVRLQRWNSELNRRQGWHVDLMTDVRSQAAIDAGRAPQDSFLLIEIQSHRPEVYDVGAWLCRGGGRPGRLRTTVQARGQAELDRCVSTLHDEVSETLGLLAIGLRVEFLLPPHLIWLPVDQTMVEPYGSVGRTLGSHREVVVRSTERQRVGEWEAPLRRRWNWLRNHAAGDHENAVAWMGPKEWTDPVALLAELRRKAETPVVYVLFEPPPRIGERPQDYFRVLMEMGIPAVLAVRRTAAADRVRQRMETCLRGALDDLPERVRVLRNGTEAGKPDDLDLHRHVSLVWDSPEALKRDRTALGQPRAGGCS